MKSKKQACKLSCFKMKILITLTFRRCLKSWIRLIKELKDELQAAYKQEDPGPRGG